MGFLGALAAAGKGVAGVLQLLGVLDDLPPLALEPGPAASLAVILCHARRGSLVCRSPLVST